MFSKTILTLLASAGLSAAVVQNYTSPLNMTIDPGSVTPQQRATWCRGQQDSCGTLCDDGTDDNKCTPDTLEYNCTCSSNHSAPGLEYYTQTMPTFICNELFSQCNAQNVGNHDDQTACIKNIQDLCATQNAKAPDDDDDDDDDDKSTTSASGTGPTGTADATGKEQGPQSTQSSKALAAPTAAPLGGAALAAAGMLAYML